MVKTKKEPKSIYFIGIKGTAMSALAVMAKNLGYEVRGSDEAETFPTDAVLASAGITVAAGFDAKNLQPRPDLIVVSAAYGLSNPEVKAAKSSRISQIAPSELLAELMSSFEGIGVAGVHGKTTTTAMLAYIMDNAGYSPSYLIGTSGVPGLAGSGHIGDGTYFIAEADEYKKSDLDNQPKFLDLPLKHVIITSIELDHPDVYETAESMYRAFYQLTTKIPRDGTIIACIDWPLVRRLVSRRADRPCLTYGFSAQAQYQIVDAQSTPTETKFSLKTATEVFGPFILKVPGQHNTLNASAAAIMALKLGVSEAAIIKALRSFQGVSRRFELLGNYNGAIIIDDFAHHPTAISYLLETARKVFPDRQIVAVFQPHTYSRTGKLLKEFAQALKSADRLILLNIYASAREKSGYVTIKDLIDEVKPYKPDVEYRSSLSDVSQYLANFISNRDVVLLIGAGDVYKVYNYLPRQS